MARAAARVRIARGAYSAGTNKINQLEIKLAVAMKLTQPWNSKKTDCEEKVEEEQHDDGHNTSSLGPIRDGACEDSHASTLASSGEKHELAATETVNNPDGDQRREEVSNAIESGKQKRQVVRHAHGRLEDDGRILNKD